MKAICYLSVVPRINKYSGNVEGFRVLPTVRKSSPREPASGALTLKLEIEIPVSRLAAIPVKVVLPELPETPPITATVIP